MEQNRRLSLQDFKDWMSEQKDLSNFFNIGIDPESPYDKYIGKSIQSKVSKNKLMERIETDGDAETLVDEFLEEGGVLLSVEEKKVLVETESGEFYLPRFCVKITKNED